MARKTSPLLSTAAAVVAVVDQLVRGEAAAVVVGVADEADADPVVLQPLQGVRRQP